jgi:glycogen synthase
MSRIAVLTYNPVVMDSRVRRICETLARADHQVTLVSPDHEPGITGLSGHRAIPSFMKSRRDVVVSVALMAPSSVLPALAEPLHNLNPAVRAARRALAETAPDIIHANDWMTLPAALGEKARSGARVVYDSHEMATEEHGDNRLWKVMAQPHIVRLERDLIARADHVMTVGDGLAEALKGLYPGLATKPTVVRNMPAKQQRQFQPVGAERILTYVGLVRPERRIDLMISSLAFLDVRHRLHIMGFGPESHRRELLALAVALGVSDRILWKPPVAPDQVANAASVADIGLFLTDQKTRQQSLAFPNKLFEYIAAGLMVVSSDTAEIGRLLHATGCGLTVQQLSAEALASVISTLSDAQINLSKRAAVQAAQQLNWEAEAKKLLGVYAALSH